MLLEVGHGASVLPVVPRLMQRGEGARAGQTHLHHLASTSSPAPPGTATAQAGCSDKAGDSPAADSQPRLSRE